MTVIRTQGHRTDHIAEGGSKRKTLVLKFKREKLNLDLEWPEESPEIEEDKCTVNYTSISGHLHSLCLLELIQYITPSATFHSWTLGYYFRIFFKS